MNPLRKLPILTVLALMGLGHNGTCQQIFRVTDGARGIKATIEKRQADGKTYEFICNTEADGTFPYECNKGDMLRVKTVDENYAYLVRRCDAAPDRVFKVVHMDEASAAIIKHISPILFESDSANLTAYSLAKLDTISAFLQKNRSLAMEVAGYADADGSNISNLSLSKMRASAVQKYLADNGIDEDRVVVIGLGESMPVHQTEKSKNRRVEFKFFENNPQRQLIYDDKRGIKEFKQKDLERLNKTLEKTKELEKR